MYHNESNYIVHKSEIYVYLDKPIVHNDYIEDFDPLKYWKTDEKRFPIFL